LHYVCRRTVWMMWEDEILKKYEIRIVSDFVTTE
jgi:hypothetical protein